MLLLKSIAVWLIFILAESINGTIRIFWLIPSLGDFWGHQLAFIVGSILIIAIATLFIPWLQVTRRSQLLYIGCLWMGLTLAFEIALGRLAFGYSWARIFADYNVLQGGLMGFGLILLVLAPLLAAKIRDLLPHFRQIA